MFALFFALILETVSASPFRVLVFPHHGAYVTPQGREAIVSKVKVSSTEVCHQYPAQLNSHHEWEKAGNLIDSQKMFLLSAAMNRNFYFECAKPFTVHRDSNLASYSYEGNFVAMLDARSGMVQIINLIDPEKYIQGVVPAEVGNQWPMEALKAQAVAARTYAWWTVLNERANSGVYYDLNDTVQYQAYLGTSNHTVATDGAVSGTSGQVMRYQGKIIKAYFSADSGGKTESAKNVFGQDLPYCVSKDELYDLSNTKTIWEAVTTLSDLGVVFSQRIQSIEVDENDVNESGRVDQVTVITVLQRKIKIPGPVFRKMMRLRSTFFELKMIPGTEMVKITGKGYGHGVGMAQIGAKEYALRLGWTFDQIVKFYYTGITLDAITNAYFE